ncbi:MAG: cupin domain-containing protein [Halobacteriaceae archaeon]
MTGESIDLTETDPHVVRQSAEETGGEFVRLESTLYPRSDAAASAVDLPHERWGIDSDFEHVHPEQEERLAVVSGELRVAWAGTERTLQAGEDVVLPADVPHRHWNPTDRPARLVWERRPALQTEAWAETVYALAQAGKTDEDGFPGLLQTLVLIDAYPAQLYPTVAPVRVQRLAASALAPVGRALGLEATHTREDVEELR